MERGPARRRGDWSGGPEPKKAARREGEEPSPCHVAGSTPQAGRTLRWQLSALELLSRLDCPVRLRQVDPVVPSEHPEHHVEALGPALPVDRHPGAIRLA